MTKLKDLKKHQIFLLVALPPLILSFIIIFVLIVYVNYQIDSTYLKNPDLINLDGFDIDFFYVITLMVIVPGYIVVLTGIRCVYKLLKDDIKGFIKACYIIAAIIAFSAIILQIIAVWWYSIPFSKFDQGFFEILIFALGLPVAIFSFILGSLPVKTKAKEKDIR